MAIADILVGPSIVWYAPVGETEPSPDSIGAGVAWGGNWAKFGYTKTNLSAEFKFAEKEAEVQEALGPVKRWRTKEELTLETILAEITAANFGLAASRTPSVTAADATHVGREDVTVGGVSTLTEYAWGFEGTYLTDAGDAYPLRVFIPKGTATINGKLDFGKEDYPGIGMQIKALHDMTQTQGARLAHFQKVTASKTA
jgi:hypothetical protein